jgi:hypothetical protein
MPRLAHGSDKSVTAPWGKPRFLTPTQMGNLVSLHYLPSCGPLLEGTQRQTLGSGVRGDPGSAQVPGVPEPALTPFDSNNLNPVFRWLRRLETRKEKHFDAC